jgi:hypothetical protein
MSNNAYFFYLQNCIVSEVHILDIFSVNTLFYTIKWHEIVHKYAKWDASLFFAIASSNGDKLNVEASQQAIAVTI